MGYTTEFYGTFKVDPPLNLAEVTYLKKFAATRRMQRHSGPYTTENPNDNCGQDHTEDVRDYNSPPEGQPGLWCQWVPTEDGAGIEWDENEKFYHAAEWMTYLIDHFLKPGCLAKAADPEKFKDFVPHVVSGSVTAAGEEPGDVWQITIVDNVVIAQVGTVTYE